MEIVLATNNNGKLKEFRDMLKEVDVKSLKDIGFKADIIEDGNSFFENAMIKAKTISEFSNMITISDDSGLVVDALDGRPGIYSARYDINDEMNNKRVLREMEGQANRTARFVCCLVIYYPDGSYKHYEETLEGEIGYEIKGTNGFGYDSIFYVDEYKMNTSEMPMELKNKISHRGKALRRLVADLKGEV